VVSFYLWWIPIILQGVLLAYIGLSLAEAARVGGSAWDILFIDAVPALVATAVTLVEIAAVFRMRGGHRGWRIALLVIGLVMLGLTAWQFSPVELTDLTPQSSMLALYALGTLGAIAAMFVPPAGEYLRSRRKTPTPPPPADPADDVSAPPG
jgi:hypothetical protein